MSKFRSGNAKRFCHHLAGRNTVPLNQNLRSSFCSVDGLFESLKFWSRSPGDLDLMFAVIVAVLVEGFNQLEVGVTVTEACEQEPPGSIGSASDQEVSECLLEQGDVEGVVAILKQEDSTVN